MDVALVQTMLAQRQQFHQAPGRARGAIGHSLSADDRYEDEFLRLASTVENVFRQLTASQPPVRFFGVNSAGR